MTTSEQRDEGGQATVAPTDRTDAVRSIMEAAHLSEEVAEAAMCALIFEGWRQEDRGAGASTRKAEEVGAEAAKGAPSGPDARGDRPANPAPHPSPAASQEPGSGGAVKPHG